MVLANERQGDGASKLSAEDAEDLATTNAAVDRMRAFTPADPYVLTIPQDVEPRYHHQYAMQARQWLEHTPFDHREHESTQYQTFIYHEPGKEMYMLHSSRPPDAGTIANADGSGDGKLKVKEKAGTGANTPNSGPKKIISLDAYKKKQTGQTPEVTPAKELGKAVKKPAAKGPMERLKEDEEVLAAVEEDPKVQPEKDEAPMVEKKDLKRKRNDDDPQKEVEHKMKAPSDTPQDVEQPAAKKQKPATPSEESPSQPEPPAAPSLPAPSPPAPPFQAAEDGPRDDNINEDKLPLKLSPGPDPEQSGEEDLPPKLSPIDSTPALPSKLSPTIPSNIEATIKAQEHLRSLSRSSDMPKDAVGRTLTPPPSKPGKKKSPAPRNGFRANSSSPAVRSDAEERGRSTITLMPRKPRLSDAESADDSEEIAVSRKRKAIADYPGAVKEPTKLDREDTKPDKPSLIVKLKFKKSSRERLRALLKTKPQPDKSLAYQSDSSKAASGKNAGRRGSNAKGVAQKVGSTKTTTTNGVTKKSAAQESLERKRAIPDESDSEEEAPVAKRKKTATNYEVKRTEPTTPSQPSARSPSSAQKSSSQVSPTNLRKDLLSVSMKRDLSTDSAMHTPNAASHSPPASAKEASQTANGTAKPPSSQPSTKTPKQEAWEKEQQRLQEIGRTAKRAVAGQSSDAKSSGQASNEKKLAAINSLESVLAFILAFTCADEACLASDPKRPPSTKPWKTLHTFYKFVKSQCEPFPVLQGLACCLGVVFNAHILELMAQSSRENNSIETILETQTMMQRAAHDAESKLDIDTLQTAFPRTWAAREKGALGPTRLEVGKGFKGPFKLPIGLQTSPVQAVRAGNAMLEEWIGMQTGLDHTLKLKL